MASTDANGSDWRKELKALQKKEEQAAKSDPSITALEDRLVQHPMNIPVGHLHLLKELSAQEGRSMQSLVREAIVLLFLKYRPKPKRGATSKRKP